MRELLADNLDIDDWRTEADHDIQTKIAAAREAIEFLRGADMCDLCSRDDFTIGPNGSEQTFTSLAQDLVESRLGLELVMAGFIDRNFALYVSQFYPTRASANVANFIVRYAQKGRPDFYYELSEPDIHALLAETDDSFLHGPAAFNIPLIDYLAAEQHPGLLKVLDRLLHLDPTAREFLTAYLQTGQQREALIRQITPLWPGVFDYLITETPQLADSDRDALVSAAAPAAQKDIHNMLNDDARVFFETRAGTLPLLTKQHPYEDLAAISDLLAAAKTTFADITGFDPGIRRMVLDSGLYEVNAINLRSASPSSIALDQLRDHEPLVYQRCLRRLHDYLLTLEEQPDPSISTVDDFLVVITEVSERDEDAVPRVIELAAKECTAASLAACPPVSWSPLVMTRRIPPSFANVSAYFNHAGFDQHVADLVVAAGGVQETASADEADKEVLAYAILHDEEVILDVAARITMVESLQLADYLDPAQITPTDGPLLSLLITHKLVTADRDLFERFRDQEWETLRPAIEACPEFSTLLTPAVLTQRHVGALIQDVRIRPEIKQAVVEAVDTYAPENTPSLTIAADYAIGHNLCLNGEQLLFLTERGLSAALIVKLLLIAGDAVPQPSLTAILQALPEPYRLLNPHHAATVYVPYDPEHQFLLDRLKAMSEIREFRKRNRKTEFAVEPA